MERKCLISIGISTSRNERGIRKHRKRLLAIERNEEEQLEKDKRMTHYNGIIPK